jgi:hypothetical protein
MNDLAEPTPAKLRASAAEARHIAATTDDDEMRAEAMALAIKCDVAADLLERADPRFHN